jgi:HSP20 family molecular chaperone IbpA
MRGYWEEIGSLEQRMDDLLRTVFGRRARLAYPALPLFVERPFVPAVDVLAREGNLVVRVELPGVDPAKDIQVSIEKGELVIKGERTQEEELEEGTYYRMERSYGAFERRLPIPEGVDEEAITATYEGGVLEVVVPEAIVKLEAPPTREIPVTTPAEIKAA